MRHTLILLLLFCFWVEAQGQYDSPYEDVSTIARLNLESFSKGNNWHRYRFVKLAFDDSEDIIVSVRSEGIDWCGIYRNVIVEKKGESDSIVYVVCHYDKVDANIFSFLNLLVNGSLDILISNFYLSKGAWDNGTGVILTQYLIEAVMEQQMHYTYRFLFTGMEEYGLRGSRRHISGLKSSEWDRVVYAINVDMVCKNGVKGIAITENISDSRLVAIAEEVGRITNQEICKNNLPYGAVSDFQTFKGQSFGKDFSASFGSNIIGAFIPQKSYFTSKKKSVPVINFTDSVVFRGGDFLSIVTPIAFTEEHSFKDKLKVVDANNLVDYEKFLQSFIFYIDENRLLISQKLHAL